MTCFFLTRSLSKLLASPVAPMADRTTIYEDNQGWGPRNRVRLLPWVYGMCCTEDGLQLRRWLALYGVNWRLYLAKQDSILGAPTHTLRSLHSGRIRLSTSLTCFRSYINHDDAHMCRLCDPGQTRNGRCVMASYTRSPLHGYHLPARSLLSKAGPPGVALSQGYEPRRSPICSDRVPRPLEWVTP